MNLALSIVALWLGAALLIVAFHQLPLQNASGGPADVIRALQSHVAAVGNASDYANPPAPAG